MNHLLWRWGKPTPLLSLLFILNPLLAQNAPPTAPPTVVEQNVDDSATFSPADNAAPLEVDEAIALLSSPKFKDRDRATTQLLAHGISALDKLQHAYRQSDDFDLRRQIEFIVQTAYFEGNVLENFGFLGISQNWNDTPGHSEDERIPEGNFAIRIASVVANTGASRAGLAKDDLLVALDGEFFSKAGRKATDDLSTRISTRGPGTTITLSIIRGDQQFETFAVLGRAPTAANSQTPPARLQHLEAKILDWAPRFASYWTDAFADPK